MTGFALHPLFSEDAPLNCLHLPILEVADDPHELAVAQLLFAQDDAGIGVAAAHQAGLAGGG